MRYIVVDEYDSVVGYYDTLAEAIAEAGCNYENRERATYVYAITPVAALAEGT